jgi:hypothetical protein
MSEIKLEAGQWYRTRGGNIVYCVGLKPKETATNTPYDAVVVCIEGFSYDYVSDGRFAVGADANEMQQEFDEDIIEHLPGCTGFDYVPTPKLQLREGAWYERADMKIVGPCRVDTEQPNSYGYKWCVGPWRYRDDGTNNVDAINHLIREVERPQPKYRAFANLKEFYPHHNRLVCVNVPNPRVLELYRVQVFNDHTFWLQAETGKSYASGLLDYQFADYVDGKIVFSPFGVIDQ